MIAPAPCGSANRDWVILAIIRLRSYASRGRQRAASASTPRGAQPFLARLRTDFQAESAVPQHQLALPAERIADDASKVVMHRLPAQYRAGAVRGGNDLRRIARTARAELDTEINAGNFLDGIDDFAHRIAAAITAIGGDRGTAAAQVTQCVQMRAHQVAHMDVVAHTGAVLRRVVGAEDVHLLAPAERGFDRNLDQMRRAPGGLASAQFRIGAGNVEITQDHVAEA